MEENKIEETGNEQHVLEKLMALFPEIPQEELSAGIEELIGTYPEADLEAICEDPQFALFARGKTLDLVTVYGDYLAFCETVEQKLTEKFRARTNRATGSGRARTSASSAGLTDAQNAFLTEWNREHPEYAMTAREYAAALKG